MTRDEAKELLGIPDAEDLTALVRAFEQRSGVLAGQIASAPNPALREKYQLQAQRLRQARDLLIGDGGTPNGAGAFSLTKQLDLPARAPIATNSASAPGPGEPKPVEPAAPAVDRPLTLTQERDFPARCQAPATTGHTPPSKPDAGNAAALSITPGQVLADRYEVRALLGSGGMGQVFAAFDRVRHEEIAVKILLPHLLADPKARERFLNEARIASSLSHTNIVRVFDVHQAAGFTFLTMERLKGCSLRDEIARRQRTAERFQVAEVVSIADQLCAALQYAHGFTVHRDVKPENIWLGEVGTVKLMDFGIARLLRPSRFTSTGLAMGTAYYMAPEQVRGQEVDHRADQFAVGVVLYELLTGEVPVGAVRPPRELRKGIPPSMAAAVMEALDSRPERRFRDMAAFERALCSARALGRRQAWQAAVAILVLALAGGGVAYRSWLEWQENQAAIRAEAEESRRKAARAAEAERIKAEAEAEKRAGAEYERARTHAEHCRTAAAGIDSRIAEEAKSGKDDVAEILIELWRKHPGRSEWLTQGEEHLKQAQTLAQQRSFLQAMEELKQAESALARPERWFTQARAALESIRKTRGLLDSRLSKLTAPPQGLLGWSEKLAAAVESKLLSEDGSAGLSDAQQLANAMPQIDGLLAARDEATAASAAARLAAKVTELRPKVEEGEEKLREGDVALQEERMGDARRLYQAARMSFAAAAERLLPYLESLVAEGEAEVRHDHFDRALERFEQLLSLGLEQGESSGQSSNRTRLPLPASLLVRAYLGRAEANNDRGDYEKAQADCNESLRLEPLNARGYVIRAEIDARQGNNEKAKADCEAAGRLDSGGILLARRTRVGVLDTKTVDLEKALRQLTAQTAQEFADRGWIYARICRTPDAAVRDQYGEKARADFDQALHMDPALARAHVWRGEFLYHLRIYTRKDSPSYNELLSRILADYDAALQMSPSSAELHLLRSAGRSDLRGSWPTAEEKAIEDLNEAIRINPRYVQAFWLRGLSYRYNSRPGSLDKAIADLSEAIRLCPGDAIFYETRGECYVRNGDYDKAFEDFSHWINLATNASEKGLRYLRRGEVYKELTEQRKMNAYNLAIADFSEGIRCRPERMWYIDLLEKRAETYQRTRSYNNALRDLTELITFDPKRDTSYLLRARLYKIVKDYNRAVADYTEAIRLNPKWQILYTERGEVYRALGDEAAAQADFARAAH